MNFIYGIIIAIMGMIPAFLYYLCLKGCWTVKKAIMVGGSNGIGLAVAKQFIEKDYHVCKKWVNYNSNTK